MEQARARTEMFPDVAGLHGELGDQVAPWWHVPCISVRRKTGRAGSAEAEVMADDFVKNAPPEILQMAGSVLENNGRYVANVALARAAGLPARTVAGLLYVNGRFYYHAWPEVYLGDWVAIDPLFDQFPADAAHVRLAVGGLARQVELVPLIGRLKLEVL